jgi:hypothetical protein
MRIEIVADYKVPADEFEDLIKVFTLGRYKQSGQSRWFTIEITTATGPIDITWFRVWE